MITAQHCVSAPPPTSSPFPKRRMNITCFFLFLFFFTSALSFGNEIFSLIKKVELSLESNFVVLLFHQVTVVDLLLLCECFNLDSARLKERHRFSSMFLYLPAMSLSELHVGISRKINRLGTGQL